MESNVLVALLVLAGAAVAAVVFTLVFVSFSDRKSSKTGRDRPNETGESTETAKDKADDGGGVER
ncbi:hypothetical protein [Rubrobacter indicoceani]|uniref:hypothetical protein n=1 Tax=Rubrobacter indicoceani TaxID=2051957 RepID=UPI000E5B3958|nr:hypothetical protein [Rubrobacter indicoceani]